jgi:hypothetical protein
MSAYWSASVTASSHGGVFGGMYTATLGTFSSATASMLLSASSARIDASAPPAISSIETPRMSASFWIEASSGNRNEPPR